MEILLSARCDELIDITDSVSIHVNDRNAAVHVELHQHKRRAVDSTDVSPESLADGSYESCFAGAEFTVQGNNSSGKQRSCQCPAQPIGVGLIETVEDERSIDQWIAVPGFEKRSTLLQFDRMNKWQDGDCLLAEHPASRKSVFG